MSDSGDFLKEPENPFRPIDTEQRLSHRSDIHAARYGLMMQPGQLYGGGLSSASKADTPTNRHAPDGVPAYLKKQPLVPEERPAPLPYTPRRPEPQIPSYLKKQAALPPLEPYPAAEAESAAAPPEGVRIASTFPTGNPANAPIRDEIAAFFEAEERTAPSVPPEEEYYPSPAFPPEKAPEQTHAVEAPGYEDAILPESAELPDGPQGNPAYQPPRYELFSTIPGAEELNAVGAPPAETPSPVPAYAPSGMAQEYQYTDGIPVPRPGGQAYRPAPTGKLAIPLVKKKDAPSKRSQPHAPSEKPVKPPIRWGRVAALIACAAMLVFCGVVGGQLLYRIEENAKEMDRLMDAYKQSGGSLIQSATRVDLPPAGQTLPSSATPPPAPARNGEGSLVQAAAGQSTDNANGQTTDNGNGEIVDNGNEPPSESVSAARSRQTRYPDNNLRNILDSMKAVHKEYPDVVGRLVIPGVLDEMVVSRDNTYYLSRNYRGTSASGGAVFMDESCSLLTPPENLLLRGQGDVAGKSFAPLWQYRDGGESFVRGAYSATLTTLYEEESYVLLAVITACSDPNQDGYFDFSSHAAFSTDADMAAYVNSAINRSLYRFSTDVTASDRLLTLATVSGGGNDQCIALLFRMKRDGE